MSRACNPSCVALWPANLRDERGPGEAGGVGLQVAAVSASALMHAFSWAVYQMRPSLMGGKSARGRRVMSLRYARGRPTTVG